MSDKPKILVISHGHPHWSFGGGEVAAWSLFQGYRRHPAVQDAIFLARHWKNASVSQIQRISAKEYLWYQPFKDFFMMQSSDIGKTVDVLRGLLENERPDIVHLQHAWLLGYEIIEVIKHFNPDIKIYFTLHEFLPICAQKGKMIKKTGKLCMRSGLDECRDCFPQTHPLLILQRKQRLLHYFKFVDKFITPSNFLQNRYIEWGLEPERLFTIENAIRPISVASKRKEKEDRKIRFGFFGQLLPDKGINLLLYALCKLPAEDKRRIAVEVHGSNLENQSEEFRKEVAKVRNILSSEGILEWRGQYQPDQIGEKMGNVDWVIVPSTWWENSPVVIQEAFACGCPVITANIGGMAEKVRDGKNGLHFQVNDSDSLAKCISRAVREEGILQRLRTGIEPPRTVDQTVTEHLRLMDVIDDWSDRIDNMPCMED